MVSVYLISVLNGFIGRPTNNVITDLTLPVILYRDNDYAHHYYKRLSCCYCTALSNCDYNGEVQCDCSFSINVQ